jgi:hypothetical protein
MEQVGKPVNINKLISMHFLTEQNVKDCKNRVDKFMYISTYVSGKWRFYFCWWTPAGSTISIFSKWESYYQGKHDLFYF